MTLDGKVTAFVLGIVICHHQLVIDPELNVLRPLLGCDN